MPIYRVTNSITGKKLKLTGDSPPTEQELEEIFASYNQPSNITETSQSSISQTPQYESPDFASPPIVPQKQPTQQYSMAQIEKAPPSKFAEASPILGTVAKTTGAAIKAVAKPIFPDKFNSRLWKETFGVDDSKLVNMADEYRDDSGKIDLKKVPKGFGVNPKLKMFAEDVKRAEENQLKQEKLKKTGQEIIKIGEILDPVEYKTQRISERIEKLKKDNPDYGAALERGDLSYVIDQAIGDYTIYGDAEKTKIFTDMRKKYQEAISAKPQEKKSILKNVIVSTMEMLPPMVKSGAKQLIPGVGKGLSYYDWMRQGTGTIAADLLDAGVDFETTKEIAPLGGAIYAGIEYSQFKKITNIAGGLGKDAIKKTIVSTILRHVKEKGIDALKESGEEGLQKIATEVTNELGKGKAGLSDKPASGIIWDSIKSGLKEAVQSLPQMGLLSLVGLGAGATKEIVSRPATTQQQEKSKQPIEAPGINLQPEVDRINAENEQIRQIAAQQPEKGTPLNVQQAPLKPTEQTAIPVQPAKPVPATEAQGVKPTPEIETLPNTPKFKEKQLIPKEEDNAKEIRGNERPVQEGGVVPKGGEDKGGENIQQPEKIRGTEVEQQAQKEVSVSRETESIADMSTIGYSDRTSYRQDLEESTKNAEQNKTKVSHAAIDMRNMGAINESFNHETANEILVNLATTFKNSVESNKPENSTIKFYRPGKGDEFAVIANGLNKDELGVLVKKGQDEVTKVINSKKYTSKTGKDINLTELVHPKHDNLETGAGYFSVGVSDFEETKDIKKMVNLADSRATEDAKDNISGIAKKSIDKRGVFVYNTNTGRWSREDSVIGKIIGEKTRSGEWKETDYNILRQKAKDEISKGGEYEYHGQTSEAAGRTKGSEEDAGQIRKQPVEGKAEKGTRAEKEVVTEKQAAVDLVESKTNKELNGKLDSIFGNIPEERLAELDDGAEFKNNDEEANYELSTKYRADLEHAATQRDYNETEKIYKEIKIHKELVKRETLPSAGRENVNAETGTPRKVRVKKEPSKTPMASAIAEAEKKIDDFPDWYDPSVIKNEKTRKILSKIARKYNVYRTELEDLVIEEKKKKLNKKPAQPTEEKKEPTSKNLPYQATILKKDVFIDYEKGKKLPFTEEYIALSPQEKKIKLTEEKRLVDSQIIKNIKEKEPTGNLVILRRRLTREQKKYSTAAKDKTRREENQLDKYAKTGNAKTNLMQDVDENIIKFINKLDILINPLSLNKFLKKQYTQNQLLDAINAIKKGVSGNAASVEIRKEIGGYLKEGVTPTQTINIIRKDESLEDRIKRDEAEGIFFSKGVKGINQGDLFGEEKSISQIEKEEKQRLIKREIELRQSKTKGGAANLDKLPMFENQNIEGSQQTLFSKPLSEATKENPITFENAKDIAKARIPQELWDKCIIRLHKTPGESQGAIYVANGVLIVDINPDTPPSRLVRVLFHDIMGHAGAANVLKTNNKIYKRLNALYNTSTAKIQKKSILNSYKDEFDKRRAEGATEQEIENELFAEWIAHNVEKYLATKDKQGLAYQVWKAIKEFLIEMGWKEDTIDEAIGSLVKEIRKTKDFKATISITPEMKESVISEGQPMFSKELQLDPTGIPVESTMDKIRQKVQDRFLRLERLQKALNPDIREEMDARLAQRLYSGRAEARLDEFENKHFKPLREKIVASKIKVDELEDFLYAKHAAERNEHIRNIRPKETEEFLTEQEMDLLNKANEIGYNKANESDSDKIEKYDKQLENIILELKNINIKKEKIIYTIAGSGMFNTTADKEAAIKTYSALDNEVLLEEIKEMPVAEEIINKFKDEGKINKLESLASDVYDITDRVRNVLLEGGLIDEETKKAWESYEFYVPLQGIKDEDKTPRVGRGFDIRGKESKRSLGRRSKAQKILSTIIVQTNEAIIRAEKNRVAKAFLNFVTANPNENLWVVDEAKKTAFFNENTGEVEYRIDPKYRLAKNIMSVKVDGKEYHITIKDNTKKENNTLARSMVNLGADNVNVVLQGFAKINRYFAQINTGFNPEFVLRNPIKDIQTAMIKLTVDHDIKTAFDVAKKIPFAIKWVLEGEADKTSEGARWYKEYKQSGGKIGYLGLSSVDDVEKTLKTEIKLMEGGTKEEIIKTGKNILKFVYAANNAVENATRLSTYIIMRQKGISKSESAKEARSVTVDFNMQGEWSKFFKPLYLFSGSSIQGSAMVLKLMKKRKMQYIAGGIVAGSIAIAEFGRLIGGKDDDDEYFYDKLPAFTRDNNLVLMGVGGKIHAKIPLPYGFSTFYAFGQAVDRVVHKNKKEDILQTTADFTTAILNSFNPLGSTANLMQTITPTSFRWITDINLNKNFFGGDVYKKPDKYGTPKAQSSTYFKGSSIPARKIAKGLNVVTGGGEYEKGIVNLPPDALDYVFEYFTGGLGKMANRLVSLPIKLSTGKKITLNEIPFVRSFVGEVSEYQDINTFYENVNNAETKRKEYESLQMDNKEKAERYYNKNKDILLLTAKLPIGKNERETTIVNKMEQEIKDLRKIKDAAEKQNKLDLVKKYEDKILALIKKYNFEFNKAGK